MKNIAILFMLAIVIGFCITWFADSRYEQENPETFDAEVDIMCGIHTQQGVDYSLPGQVELKDDKMIMWFYPNDKKIFAIEVIGKRG